MRLRGDILTCGVDKRVCPLIGLCSWKAPHISNIFAKTAHMGNTRRPHPVDAYI